MVNYEKESPLFDLKITKAMNVLLQLDEEQRGNANFELMESSLETH